jgi:hypothetical protein
MKVIASIAPAHRRMRPRLRTCALVDGWSIVCPQGLIGNKPPSAAPMAVNPSATMPAALRQPGSGGLGACSSDANGAAKAWKASVVVRPVGPSGHLLSTCPREARSVRTMFRSAMSTTNTRVDNAMALERTTATRGRRGEGQGHVRTPAMRQQVRRARLPLRRATGARIDGGEGARRLSAMRRC